MDPLIRAYAARLDIIRAQAREAVQGLDADALNWTPAAPETNSVAALVHHMWGVERFFIRQVVGGRDIGRDRDAIGFVHHLAVGVAGSVRNPHPAALPHQGVERHRDAAGGG